MQASVFRHTHHPPEACEGTNFLRTRAGGGTIMGWLGGGHRLNVGVFGARTWPAEGAWPLSGLLLVVLLPLPPLPRRPFSQPRRGRWSSIHMRGRPATRVGTLSDEGKNGVLAGCWG